MKKKSKYVVKLYKWTKYCKEGASLEIFVDRPENSTFYYVLGSPGRLLVNRNKFNETIQVHSTTIEILAGESKSFCNNRTIMRVELSKV